MLDEATPYRFYLYAARPQWRLVVHAARGWPSETAAEQWIFTRARRDADTNPDVRDAIDRTGYCLFKIDCTFAELDDDIKARG